MGEGYVEVVVGHEAACLEAAEAAVHGSQELNGLLS